MAPPLKTGMPQGLDLPGSYIVRFTAVDPVTGALVAGVEVSNVSILLDDSGGTLPTTLAFLNPVLLRAAH